MNTSSVVEARPRPQAPPTDPRDPPVLPAPPDDYPETEDTVRAAIADCNVERAKLGLPLVTEPTNRERRRHADLETIDRLMERHGAKQVWLWVQDAAARRGYRGE